MARSSYIRASSGKPCRHDRRLPPSVRSGFAIVAEDERRNLFQSTSIIDQGLSTDGRFLGVTTGGPQANVGGGVHLSGLSVRAGNLMTDYLNSLSDAQFLQKRPEPLAPELNVVHRSEEGLFGLYRTNVFDRDGERGTVRGWRRRVSSGWWWIAGTRSRAMSGWRRSSILFRRDLTRHHSSRHHSPRLRWRHCRLECNCPALSGPATRTIPCTARAWRRCNV